jgi:hypothetical protein
MRRSVHSGLILVVFGLFLGVTCSWAFDEAGSARCLLRLRIRGPLAAEGEPQVRAVAVWFGKGKVEPRSAPVSSTAPSSIELPSGRWSLQAEAVGYWGAPEYLDVGAEAREVTLDLWPAGRVEGGFILPEGEQAPKEIAVFFRSDPGSPGALPPPSKALCPVTDGTWHCTLPAGFLDLRFQADGFIPRYQWGIAVPRGRALSLGRFDLSRGSAVLGWVVTADRSRIAEGTRAEVRPRMGGSLRQEGEEKRVQSLAFSAPVNERGFFQVDGVPPGAYVVEVHQAPFAPATATVRVVAGEVTEVANPPLLLDLPKSLEVFLNPPVDPAGEPWSVRLAQLDRGTMAMKTFATELADEAGAWKKPGLAKGTYLLKVGPKSGDTWLTQELEIDDNPAPVYLDLKLVKVTGTVRWGKNPLPAVLTFGGRFGSSKITVQADAEGRFELYLPKPGEWPVWISSDTPPVARELGKVRIEPRLGKEVAEIDLVLPDTELRGRVVDESGKSVPKAIVSVKSADTSEPLVQDWADEKGRFALVGLPAGKLLVAADGGEELYSDLVPVQVAEGSKAGEVKLVVRSQVRITGTLVSPAGVVPGARIKAAPAGVPYFGVRSVTSDARGRFELVLAPSAREMFIAVAAPGFAFRMLRLPVPADRQLTLGVEQSVGTLILETGSPHLNPEPDGPVVYLFHQGSVEGLPLLNAWALSSGALPEDPAVSTVPAMEPGDYRACWVLPAERAGLDFGIVPQGRCAEGFLSPNGELRLKLPDMSARGL